MAEVMKKSNAVTYEPNAYQVDLYCKTLKEKFYVSEQDGHLTIDYRTFAEAFYNAGYRKVKTCKNVSEMHPVDGFTCSECGISLVDYVEERVDEEEYDTTYYEYEIKYCPNCGAKVVEE